MIMTRKYFGRWLDLTLRIVGIIALALLCDFGFFTHMAKKWALLDQHNKDYWKGCSDHQWNVSEVKALFGKPDSITSNSMSYMAFDFTNLIIPLPFTGILLTGSLDHFHRHDIEFFVDGNDMINGSSDATGEGIFRHKAEHIKLPEHPKIHETVSTVPLPATFDHAWVMSSGWAGYMGVAVALTSNKYYYWFYSDVVSGDEPTYPISGNYQYDEKTLTLKTKERMYSTTWVVVTNGGRRCLSSPKEIGDTTRLLIPDSSFSPSDPFRNQRTLKTAQSTEPHPPVMAGIPLGTARRFDERMMKIARRVGIECQMDAFSQLVHRDGVWMTCGDVQWEFADRQSWGMAVAVSLVPKEMRADGKHLADFEGFKVVVPFIYEDPNNENPELKKTAKKIIALIREPLATTTNELSSVFTNDHGLTVETLQQFHQLMAEVVQSSEFDCLIEGFPECPVNDDHRRSSDRGDVQWSFFPQGKTNLALTVRLAPKGTTPPDKCLFEFRGFDAVIHYTYEQVNRGASALKKASHTLVKLVRGIEAERPAMLTAAYELALNRFPEQEKSTSRSFFLLDEYTEPPTEFIANFSRLHPKIKRAYECGEADIGISISDVSWGGSNSARGSYYYQIQPPIEDCHDFRLSKSGSKWIETQPILTASILLPDGTATNGCLGQYTLHDTTENYRGSSGGPADLKWYSTDLPSGTHSYTLATSNMTSDAITVNVQNDVASPSNILFRMKLNGDKPQKAP